MDKMNKIYYKYGFLSLLIFTVLLIPINSFCLPRSLCIEKVLEIGKISGTVVGAGCEENICFAEIKVDDNELYYLNISYGDVEKYKNVSGKPVNIHYEFTRFWNEHDMVCSHDVVPTRIQLLDGNRTSNVKKFKGYVETFNEAGMSFIRLVDKNEKPIAFLGGFFEYSDSVSACLRSALESGKPVEITGSIKSLENGEISIDTEKPVTCKKFIM